MRVQYFSLRMDKANFSEPSNIRSGSLDFLAKVPSGRGSELERWLRIF